MSERTIRNMVKIIGPTNAVTEMVGHLEKIASPHHLFSINSIWNDVDSSTSCQIAEMTCIGDSHNQLFNRISLLYVRLHENAHVQVIAYDERSDSSYERFYSAACINDNHCTYHSNKDVNINFHAKATDDIIKTKEPNPHNQYLTYPGELFAYLQSKELINLFRFSKECSYRGDTMFLTLPEDGSKERFAFLYITIPGSKVSTKEIHKVLKRVYDKAVSCNFYPYTYFYKGEFVIRFIPSYFIALAIDSLDKYGSSAYRDFLFMQEDEKTVEYVNMTLDVKNYLKNMNEEVLDSYDSLANETGKGQIHMTLQSGDEVKVLDSFDQRLSQMKHDKTIRDRHEMLHLCQVTDDIIDILYCS